MRVVAELAHELQLCLVLLAASATSGPVAQTAHVRGVGRVGRQRHRRRQDRRLVGAAVACDNRGVAELGNHVGVGRRRRTVVVLVLLLQVLVVVMRVLLLLLLLVSVLLVMMIGLMGVMMRMRVVRVMRVVIVVRVHQVEGIAVAIAAVCRQ